MSTYIVNKSDGTSLVAVPEATINTSACSVALVGRRATGYGELMAENFVKVVENFAHTSPPPSPMTGQLWFDKSTTTLKVYTSSTWAAVVNVSSGGSSVAADQFTSTAATGTAPFQVASTTKVTNLNADYVDGYSVETAANANSLVARDSNGDVYANQMYATLFNGTATSARYADVAERFEASEPLQPGDVVEIGGDKEIVKARTWGGSALGVISTAPAFRMNDDAGTDETHPFVAFTGRVPCRVTGPVRKGDRLAVSRVAGVAEVLIDHGFVIGRALEDKSDDGIGTVMIVIGVK